MTATRYLEDAELTVDDALSTVVHFGPFDGPADVRAAAVQFVADGLAVTVDT